MTRLIKGVDGVDSAEVDHNTGKAMVTVKPGATVTAGSLREAVEKDYTVESVSEILQ